MKKDFWKWHSKKEEIDEKDTRIFFHEREIWFAHLGANVGFEQDGKGENFGRPVLIFRKFNPKCFAACHSPPERRVVSSIYRLIWATTYRVKRYSPNYVSLMQNGFIKKSPLLMWRPINIWRK
jgi:hypothetical protein